MKFTKKLTITALLSAFALLSFVLEGLFPPLFIPGARLGISNVFILLAVIIVGKPYAYAVLIVKVVLGSLFAGNVSSIMYSLPAGTIALTVEIVLLVFAKRLSVVSISTAGSVISLTVQNTVFCLITGGTEYFIYLPYLALIGTVAGVFVGIVVYFAIKFLPKKIYTPNYTEEKV